MHWCEDLYWSAVKSRAPHLGFTIRGGVSVWALSQCHASWSGSLPVRLNELPARPAELQLLGEEAGLIKCADFLTEKGYQIEALQTTQNYQKIAQKQPGLVVFEPFSRPLWSPSGLLKTTCNWHQSEKLASRACLGLGGGGGRDAVYLARQGWQVTAIDQEERVLQRARQLAHYNQAEIDWRACSLNQADCFPNESFDLIVVVRYLNRDLFKQMASALKPNGLIGVSNLCWRRRSIWFT